MATGYFASLAEATYRETVDGQRVTSRRLAPLLPARWALVPAEAQARYERRVKQAHIALLIAIPFAISLLRGDGPEWRLLTAAVVLGLIFNALTKLWATAGLPAYDRDTSTIVPVSYLEKQLRQARVMGSRTLAGFIALSVVLAVPQLVVAVTAGRWWAWLGFAMFAGSGILFARLLARLDAEETAASAS